MLDDLIAALDSTLRIATTAELDLLLELRRLVRAVRNGTAPADDPRVSGHGLDAAVPCSGLSARLHRTCALGLALIDHVATGLGDPNEPDPAAAQFYELVATAIARQGELDILFAEATAEALTAVPARHSDAIGIAGAD